MYTSMSSQQYKPEKHSIFPEDEDAVTGRECSLQFGLFHIYGRKLGCPVNVNILQKIVCFAYSLHVFILCAAK